MTRRRLAVGALVAIVAAAALGGGVALRRHLMNQPTATSHPLSPAQLAALSPTPAPSIDPTPDASPSPAAPLGHGLLQVPYTVQAPFNNWKQFENACEEAALLMYHDYLEGDHRDTLPPAEVDPALRALEQWQVKNWGAEKDLTLDRTGQLAQAYYGYHYQVMPATKENIELAIDSGEPVVIPVMTHSLQNHYYGPQTVYHEVLIKGYTSAGVVANDAGVMQGRNWFYSWSVIDTAMDAQAARMGQGRVMLTLQR